MSPAMVHKRTKIIHPDIIPGPNSGMEFSKVVPGFIQELFKDQLNRWTARALAGLIKQNAREFIAAAEEDNDGLTMMISIQAPPGFSTLKSILSNYSMNISQDFLDGNPGQTVVKVHPGFYYR